MSAETQSQQQQSLHDKGENLEVQSQSTLTALADRDPENFLAYQKRDEKLTVEETKAAVADLYDKSFVNKYPRSERYNSDPIHNGQVYHIMSFVPARGATPDKDGLFGMFKCRGTFMNETDMNERAEWLIRNVDSFHPMRCGWVGKPMPLALSSNWCEDHKEVDIRKKVVEVISNDVKHQKDDEQREMREIEAQEQRLLQDCKEDEVNPFEKYTELRLKKANIIFTVVDVEKKVAEMKKSLREVLQNIDALDAESPDYKESYMERYMKAREAAGIKTTDDDITNYMGDGPLPFEM